MNEHATAARPGPLVVEGTRTHVLDHGGPASARNPVCLHGFGGSAGSWDLVAPLLAGDSRVITPDLHGHGLTSPAAAPTTQDVLEQIGEVLREVPTGSGPVVLRGSSFGDAMALELAARHPDRHRDRSMALERWLMSVPGVSGAIYRRATAMSPEEVVDRQLVAVGTDAGSPDRATRRDAMALQARRHHDRASHDSQQLVLRSLLRLLEQGRRFASTIAAVEAPVLWRHGDDDPLVPEPQARALTDPAWVADSVRAWLDPEGSGT